MSTIAVRVGASAVAILLASYPQPSGAQGFTGAEFATWSEASQDGYIQTSVTMAAVIAAQVNGEVAGCLDAWYAPGQPVQSERNALIRSFIAEHADFHPSGVILAVLQDACGPIGN